MSRIASITIRDLLGTRWVEFQPGTLTTVTGANGSGKTSILEALKKIWEGGHDPTLLRRGAKIGEAKVTLQDGTIIQLRVTKKGTTYEITDPAGQEVKAPRSFIQELGDCLAIDPSRILLAKPKELAEILLEVMPIQFTQEELQQATGPECWVVNTDMTLAELDVLYGLIYAARTEANRHEREASATANTLRGSLVPEDGDTDWNARLTEFRQLLKSGEQEREGEIQGVDRLERENIQKIKDKLAADIESLRAAAQQSIELEVHNARQARKQIDEKFGPNMKQLADTIAQTEERASHHERAKGARALLVQYERNQKTAASAAEGFTRALANLDQLRTSKLSSLPIPGLEMRDDDVYLDGIPFQRVNLSERIKIAFQLAALRAGSLPFMILDQAEAMDASTWEVFKQGAAQSGFQIIAARVGDGPLSIETLA